MGLLFILPILVLSVWLIASSVRMLRHLRPGPAWWRRFALLGCVGLIAGIWCAFGVEYTLAGKMRLSGFPVPVAISRLEEGTWVSTAIPDYLRYLGMATNLVSLVAIALFPLRVALLIRMLKGPASSGENSQ